ERIVAYRLARFTRQVQLDINGLTIGALRGTRREWIAPEVVDVLHMLRIVAQLTNQAVVIPVSFVAEGLLSLQDDHRHTAGADLLEVFAQPLRRLERRRILGILRYRMLLRDPLKWRNSDIHEYGDRQPRQDDRH